MASYALRGEVTKRWEAAGCRRWDYETTRSECLEVNNDFAEMGENPTPRFREEIEKKNESYIRRWILGCHFNWLNPR